MPPNVRDALLVEVDCRNFSAGLARLNGVWTIEFTCNDLVWAALTAGYPTHDHLPGAPGTEQHWADSFRIALIYAYLDSHSDGTLKKSSTYERADASEKAAISYYLGLFLTKLACQQLLNADFVWHLDTYIWTRADDDLRLKPDLVARSWRGAWYVLEAKGRSRGFSPDEADRAKRQVENISQLITSGGPRSPQARITSFVFFGQENICRVRWSDPDLEPSSDLKIQPSKVLLERYYDPVRRLATEQGEVSSIRLGGVRYDTFYLADVDVWVGAPRQLLRATDLSWQMVRETVAANGQDSPTGPVKVDAGESSWWRYSDGISIRLGHMWEPAP